MKMKKVPSLKDKRTLITIMLKSLNTTNNGIFYSTARN